MLKRRPARGSRGGSREKTCLCRRATRVSRCFFNSKRNYIRCVCVCVFVRERQRIFVGTRDASRPRNNTQTMRTPHRTMRHRPKKTQRLPTTPKKNVCASARLLAETRDRNGAGATAADCCCCCCCGGMRGGCASAAATPRGPRIHIIICGECSCVCLCANKLR